MAAKAKKKRAPKKRVITKEQKRCITLVKKARRGGWKLEQIAQHLDCSFASIWRWERWDGKGNGALPYDNTARRVLPLLEELVA